MPQNYVFMTDSDSDLYYQIADERHIQVVRMPYALDGVEYLDDNGRSGNAHEFFQRMRDGAVPVTCPWDILEYYRWGKRPEAPDVNPHGRVVLDEDEEKWRFSSREGFAKPPFREVKVETDGQNPQHPAVLNAFGKILSAKI